MDIVLQQEELLWFQKSRLEALRDGDRNTKFFHLSTVNRRPRNQIEMLQNSEGQWLSDTDEVKVLVVDYWRVLFQDKCPNYVQTEFMPNSFPPIPHADWPSLTRPYASCEVQAAIMSMRPYKAPGPDDF